MTPSTVCRVVEPGLTVSAFKEREKGQPFSRYPVMSASGEAKGYIHKSDLLDSGPDQTMQALAREVSMVHTTLNIEDLFSAMLTQRQHMAVVYDDHGTWVGLIWKIFWKASWAVKSWMKPITWPTCACMRANAGTGG